MGWFNYKILIDPKLCCFFQVAATFSAVKPGDADKSREYI